MSGWERDVAGHSEGGAGAAIYAPAIGFVEGVIS